MTCQHCGEEITTETSRLTATGWVHIMPRDDLDKDHPAEPVNEVTI